LETLQADVDRERAERMADPLVQEAVARHNRPHETNREKVNLGLQTQFPDDGHDEVGHKVADEEQSHRLGIMHLEVTMKAMKEELANLEAVKKELDDQKAAEVEANQDISDDDADLDSYSDSVEKWELKDG
jgi:hypothetical protein